MPTGGGGGGVGGFPLNLYQWGLNPDSAVGAIANKVIYTGFLITAPVKFANLTVTIGTGDGVNNSDIGIYSADGSTLLANIGAQHIAGTGPQTFAIVQTSVTLNPGRYILALTSAAGTITIQRDGHWGSWCISSTGVGTSSGGALPASIPAPTVAINSSGAFVVALYT